MRCLLAVFVLSVTTVQGATFRATAEIPIPGTNYGFSAGGLYPLITAARSGFLATWLDARAGSRPSQFPHYELRAARIGANGVNREYTGITLETCDPSVSTCTNVSSTFADGSCFVA